MMGRWFTAFRFDRWWKWVLAGLWVILLIGLPLTSFPLFTHLTGATVAPFSALPLGALLLVWFIPYLVRRGSLPKETIPFMVFTVLVIGLAAFALFQWDQIYRSKSLLSQTVRSFIPFGIGLAVYLVTAAWHKGDVSLKRTVQWIMVGGILLLVWAVLQAIVVTFLDWKYPPLLNAIKNALVTQSNMSGNPRLAGLTWEPSWFAHQLNMLYLPLWLSASYLRTSVFPRLWKISVENVCLVVGMGVFFLSSPRIGGAAMMLMLLFLFIKFNLAAYRWVIKRLKFLVNRTALARFAVGAILIVTMVGTYLGFSYAVLRVVSERDWRVGLLLKTQLSQSDIQRITAFDENTLFYLGLRFAFLERTVYWMDGWHIFNDYPLLGVGLGNSGYYFFSHLPAVGWSSIEVRAVIYRNTGLPNIKSIWFRLLAETGIVGFTLFVTWLFVSWSSASRSMRSANSAIKTIALAGQLAILAYIFEGFSVDTFGLPYLFVMMGLVASAGYILRHPARKVAG